MAPHGIRINMRELEEWVQVERTHLELTIDGDNSWDALDELDLAGGISAQERYLWEETTGLFSRCLFDLATVDPAFAALANRIPGVNPRIRISINGTLPFDGRAIVAGWDTLTQLPHYLGRDNGLEFFGVAPAVPYLWLSQEPPGIQIAATLYEPQWTPWFEELKRVTANWPFKEL